MKEIADAFPWPLSRTMAKASESGIRDYLHGYKRIVRLFSWQVYLNAIHTLLAASGLIIVALSVDLK